MTNQILLHHRWIMAGFWLTGDVNHFDIQILSCQGILVMLLLNTEPQTTTATCDTTDYESDFCSGTESEASTEAESDVDLWNLFLR